MLQRGAGAGLVSTVDRASRRVSSAPLIGLVAAVRGVLWALTPHFLTVSNLLNIASRRASTPSSPSA